MWCFGVVELVMVVTGYDNGVVWWLWLWCFGVVELVMVVTGYDNGVVWWL